MQIPTISGFSSINGMFLVTIIVIRHSTSALIIFTQRHTCHYNLRKRESERRTKPSFPQSQCYCGTKMTSLEDISTKCCTFLI